MIRPLTIATFLMACGSGLYLYQSKHEVQVLDHTIERTVHETSGMREQSRLLAAEWTMLTNPERLRQFSDMYLKLKTSDPKQFTSLVGLDERLPAVQPAVQQGSEAEPVAGLLAPVVREPAAVALVGKGMLPALPVPAARPAPVVVTMARPSEMRSAETRGAEVRGAETRMVLGRALSAETLAHPAIATDLHPLTQRLLEARADGVRPDDARASEGRGVVRGDAHAQGHEARPAVLAAKVALARPVNEATTPGEAKPLPVVASAPSPGRLLSGGSTSGGSMLGMARGTMVSSPRPVPMNAAYDAN